MIKNANSNEKVSKKLELLKSKFNLQEDVVSTLKISNYVLLSFLFIGIIGFVVDLILFISLILMHTINSLYTVAPLNMFFVFMNIFLIFNNVYFITFCIVTYVIYKKEKRNIMFFAPLVAIILTTLSSILSIVSLATNIFTIDWAVFFIQLFASLISLFFFFNNYPNIRKKVDFVFEKMLKLNTGNKPNINNQQTIDTPNKNKSGLSENNQNNKNIIETKKEINNDKQLIKNNNEIKQLPLTNKIVKENLDKNKPNK